jgi:hypothetical protein
MNIAIGLRRAPGPRLANPGACTQSLLESVSDGVLAAAKSALHMTGSLVGLAFSFEFLISGQFACGFLECALEFLCGTFDPVLIHDKSFRYKAFVQVTPADASVMPYEIRRLGKDLQIGKY